jgi:hypothetical protein
MAERFPLIVNPVTRKIEEIKETDSLELTGNGISISGSTGLATQYLRSTGSGELEWVDPIEDFSTRSEVLFGGNLTVNGTLDVGGDVILGVDSFDSVVTSGKFGVETTSNTLTARFSVGTIQNTLTNKGGAAFKTFASSDGALGESAIYIEEQTGSDGWYLKVNSAGSLSFVDSAYNQALALSPSQELRSFLPISVDGGLYNVKDPGNGAVLQFKTNATDIIFNNPYTSGLPTSNVNLFVRRGSLAPTSLRWNEIANRWQFTNDGVQYYNILTPDETLSAAADEFGASADPNRYNISATETVTVDGQSYLKVTLQNISDIQKFTLKHQVKMFGASNTSAGSLPSQPDVGATYAASVESTVFNDQDIPHSFYVYAIAAYRLDNGDISASTVGTQIIENINSAAFNEANYNSINIPRVSNTGIALYRGEFATYGAAQSAVINFNTNISSFKLINILGLKEFGNDSLVSEYVDYGSYDVPLWTRKNIDSTYKEEVHFPLNPPLVAKRGWVVGSVRDINGANGTFRIDVPGVVASSTADWNLYLYHDDTLNIQEAIDTTAAQGRNYLIIPGGTYLIDHIKLPSGFTLGGLNDATVFKKQFWTTTNYNSTQYEGMKNAMFFSDSFNSTVSQNLWTLKDFTLRDLVIDGNSVYQILFGSSFLGEETNNCCIGIPNSDFVRILFVKVRNTYGPALFAEGSNNLQINGTTFLDGMQTERYGTNCILMSDCENTTIGSSFFRNFPGALDFTTGQILSMSGCVVRNCGSGIQIYGSVNTDVLNNIILGPVDEFIPVPDLYDTDYDGVNISIFPGQETQTPVYQYQSEGNNVDLSNSFIKFQVYPASVSSGVELVNLSNPLTDVQFQYFNPVDAELNPQDDITLGQLRFKITADQSLNVPDATVNSYLVYRILGIDYADIGSDVEFVLDTGTVIGTDEDKTYRLTVTNKAAYDAVVEGDYIKLASHNYAPDIGVNVWKIVEKIVDSENRLNLQPYQEDSLGNLTLMTGLSTIQSGGSPSLGGGYIQVRQQFIIAKGVISRVQ